MRETPEAARAFEQYYNLGDDRTLLLLAQKRRQEIIDSNQDDTKKIPSENTVLSHLKSWSSVHAWQDRVIARDREQFEKERKKNYKAIQAMNERHALIGTTQQAKAIKQIEELIKAKSFGSMAAVQLLKLAIDVERVARGASTEQIALTGRDGGPIETDVIVETFWGRGTDPRKRKEEDKPEETPQQSQESNNESEEEEPEISVEFGEATTNDD